MEGMIEDFPYWGAWLFMYVLGTLRGQGTYWLGRAANHAARSRPGEDGTWWHRVSSWLSGEKVRAGRTVIHKLGLVAIPLGYLTVGLQTAILLGAGVIGISWAKFSIAQIPGAMAWATIYSSVGFVGWKAVVALVQGGNAPLFFALIAVAIAAVAIITMVRKGINDKICVETKVESKVETK